MHAAAAARDWVTGGGTKFALHSGSSDGMTGIVPMHSSAPHPGASSARVAAGMTSANATARNARSMGAFMAPPFLGWTRRRCYSNPPVASAKTLMVKESSSRPGLLDCWCGDRNAVRTPSCRLTHSGHVSQGSPGLENVDEDERLG